MRKAAVAAAAVLLAGCGSEDEGTSARDVDVSGATVDISHFCIEQLEPGANFRAEPRMERAVNTLIDAHRAEGYETELKDAIRQLEDCGAPGPARDLELELR